MGSNHLYDDVWEPTKVSSNRGFHVFDVFIGDSTREFVVHFLKNETDWFNVFAKWKAWVEIEMGSMLKRLGSNSNGDQFCCDEFVIHKASIGIERLKKIPIILQGMAESVVREITERARSMKCFIELSKQFWADSVVSAVNIESWYALDLGLLEEITWTENEVIIYTSFVYSSSRSLLDYMSSLCMFIGYVYDDFGDRSCDARNQKIIQLIDVISNDDVFYEDMDKWIYRCHVRLCSLMMAEYTSDMEKATDLGCYTEAAWVREIHSEIWRWVTVDSISSGRLLGCELEFVFEIRIGYDQQKFELIKYPEDLNWMAYVTLSRVKSLAGFDPPKITADAKVTYAAEQRLVQEAETEAIRRGLQ
ncbi:hypothetical protein GIB67_041370 [Kingdonia uniflora]|uniref:Uncharacterized protein n=1 Tax=Kingdonia uniflora TaxID=39325 RepID=A0A7J7NIU7_9MAGN|nr:hypothetical protein GIB67_041370 [Kingdonia uniflora]